MNLLTKEQQESFENKKICYICKDKLENKDLKEKRYWNHCYYRGEYRGAVHSICNLKYSAIKNSFSFS